ncbi:MAG: NADH:ubiquinone oxidoreductase, Na translocating, B subunit [Spirochaetes bacterium RIFOXYC1_FULL_54_7]|nr:MAG: NADH:ubiquinone oxidoreductase, Na translocating, B subunit [Spirochaetes bacterium RIFOXYC1_FULL_54_7]
MFQKQAVMRRVLYALTPIAAFAVWLYGLRVLAVLAVSLAVGVLVEYLFEKKKGGKVSEAVLVTATLFALSMPPGAPLWIVAIGIAFAVFMAKEVYGGFGRNIFNPAIAGRLFVYISFAGVLGNSFYEPGNFGAAAGSLFGKVDAVTAVTPLAALRAGTQVPLLGLLTGIRPGSIGESSVILIVAAAIYLLVTKTAQWRLMMSTVIGGAVAAGILMLAGIPAALPLEALLAGSFLFVAVFMSTDPVSAPKKQPAQLVYGLLIGVVVVVIRTFSLFPEGTSFAILIGNTFASLFDRQATASAKRKAGSAMAAAAKVAAAKADVSKAAPSKEAAQ